jgi:hypothetical protein
MAKTPKKPKPEDIETEPDAWERFSNVVDVLAKTPPKPKKAKPKPKSEKLKSK